MKKSAMTAAVFLLAAGIFAGCGKKQADQTALEDKTLPEIVDLIYEQKDPGLAVATTEVDTGDAAALKYSTGLESGEGVEAAAVSEAMISAQAYSLVLVRAEDAADTEALAQKMQEGHRSRQMDLCPGGRPGGFRLRGCGHADHGFLGAGGFRHRGGDHRGFPRGLRRPAGF